MSSVASSSVSVSLPTSVSELHALHHKMSKKVAQLTKVIYLLNSKNDEHAYELSVLESTFEQEIDHVLKDAKERVITMNTQINKKVKEIENIHTNIQMSNEKSVQTSIEELKKQNSEEKNQFEKKINSLKEQAVQNENTLRNLHREKIESVKKEDTR